MRSIAIVLGGFALLGLCLLSARWLGGAGMPSLVTGARIFIPLWLILAGINMWVGVTRAGYTIAEELPIFLFIFGVPAAAAAFLWWKFQ
jgi:hypothetical protein